MGDEGPSLVRSALLEALALKNFLLIEMRDEEPAFVAHLAAIRRPCNR